VHQFYREIDRANRWKLMLRCLKGENKRQTVLRAGKNTSVRSVNLPPSRSREEHLCVLYQSSAVALPTLGVCDIPTLKTIVSHNQDHYGVMLPK
jgi:hypothetical protein